MIGLILPMNLTAVSMKVPEGSVAFVEELPGAYTQGQILEQARNSCEKVTDTIYRFPARKDR